MQCHSDRLNITFQTSFVKVTVWSDFNSIQRTEAINANSCDLKLTRHNSLTGSQ